MTQDSRRPTFHLFNQSVDTKLRIHFHKQMYVVRHDLHFDDFSTAFIRYGSENFLEPFIYTVHQNLSAILRAPNNVVFA